MKTQTPTNVATVSPSPTGQRLLSSAIRLHFPLIKPGGFLVINIADILVFRDPAMPRVQAEAVRHRRSHVSREDVLHAMTKHPGYTRY